MFLDRRYLHYFDWISLLTTVALCAIGLLFIYSTTYQPHQPYSLYFKKQLFGLISGMFIYCGFCIIDYRTILRVGYWFYFLVIGLLVFTIVKGSIGMGAQRWIDIGIIKLQPSELTKLIFPAFATYYLYEHNDTFIFTYKDFTTVLITLCVSCILILKQPDLGTALLLLFSGFVMLWFAGIGRKFFATLFIGTLFFSPLLWRVLKPYQKKRVLVFLGQGELNKERYQIEQSKIALGSGGATGKGLLQGTQNRLQFLPERRTDFIFSIIGEELGFAGALFVLLLYALLFARFFVIIASIPLPFMQLLTLGIITPIILSVLINIGMVIGLLPTVGIPLPLLSYGVSNLWVTLAALGWINGIAMRRFYMGI